jgi:hypothetical protein
MMGGLQRFVHRENIAHYKKLIVERERGSSHNQARNEMLLRWVAEARDRREPNR